MANTLKLSEKTKAKIVAVLAERGQPTVHQAYEIFRALVAADNNIGGRIGDPDHAFTATRVAIVLMSEIAKSEGPDTDPERVIEHLERVFSEGE